MNKIKRVSLLFRIFFQLIFIGWPVLLVAAWVTSPESMEMMGGMIKMNFIPQVYSAAGSHGGILHALSYSERLFGFGLSLFPMLIHLFILYSLIKLFKLYENGEIFSIHHVNYFKNIAYALIAGQLINPIYEGLMGFVLTWHNPPGHRFAAVTLNQTNIAILFTALLIILISWIMAEGCQLREEQQLTI